MWYTFKLVLIFGALMLVELLLHELVLPSLMIPVVLPFILVFALEVTSRSPAPERAYMAVAVMGGLVAEIGSAITPGVLLVTYIVACVLASQLLRWLFSQVSALSLSVIVFLAVVFVRVCELLIVRPLFILGVAPLTLGQNLLLYIVLPALLALPIAFMVKVLLEHPKTSWLFAELFPSDMSL